MLKRSLMGLLRPLTILALINIIFAQGQEQCKCADIAVSAEDCAFDEQSGTRSSGQHSPCNHIGYSGDTAVLWQLFNVTVDQNETNSSVCMLELIAEWDRTLRLNQTTDLQSLSQTLLINSDTVNSGYVILANATLTLLDIQNQPDTDSEYEVTLTVQNCTDIPTPVQSIYKVTYNNPLKCPFMNVTFIGGDQSVNTFFWLNPDGKMICFTSGVTKMISGYSCGWTITDESSCNNTVWLKLNHCNKTDDGNYTVYSNDGLDVSQSAYVLLSFQELETEMQDSSAQGIIAGSVSASLFLILIVITVIIITVVCVVRNKQQASLINVFTNVTVEPTGSEVGTMINTSSSTTGKVEIWTGMAFPDKQLTRNDLVHIIVAEIITDWKLLARHLDLSETDIISIETKDPRNYKEQTFQMLLKWLNQQGYPPSRKDFVQIIAKMDIVLAKEFNSVFTALDVETE